MSDLNDEYDAYDEYDGADGADGHDGSGASGAYDERDEELHDGLVEEELRQAAAILDPVPAGLRRLAVDAFV
ncbi:hypothetical protein ACFWJ3_31440, partial [Streptomyces ardesiacus]